MLRIREMKILIPADQEAAPKPERRREQIRRKAAGMLHVSEPALRGIHIRRHGIDARKKPLLYDVYTVDIELAPGEEEKILSRKKGLRNVEKISPELPAAFPDHAPLCLAERPVIVGAGPAGLFCTLYLAGAGLNPILIERGDDTEERDAAVSAFRSGQHVDPESNVQFGMGGAGTYSDGKLYTGIRDTDGTGRMVLETLVSLGAPEDILYEAHPHIGTDVLKLVMRRMCSRLKELGAEIRFRTRLEDLAFDGRGALCGIETSKGTISSGSVILATGHSARDTFEKLQKRGLSMEPKAFAVGFRVAHPQEWIDRAQYGRESGNGLPPAIYKLTARDMSGRGVYSFCMCPGGRIVNASSEEGMLCVNGMSERARNGAYANSALVIQVTPDDYRRNGHPLEGVFFQRELERRAFAAGNGRIPVMTYADFAESLGISIRREMFFPGTIPDAADAFSSGFCMTDLSGILPRELSGSILLAMEEFGGRILGYDDPRVLFAGVESRTSSPVRIPRGEDGAVPGHPGVYPCGEGAGYAGGIMSAAVDGIRTARKLIQRYETL